MNVARSGILICDDVDPWTLGGGRRYLRLPPDRPAAREDGALAGGGGDVRRVAAVLRGLTPADLALEPCTNF